MAAVNLTFLLIRQNLFLLYAYRQGKVNKNKKHPFWIRRLYQERDQKSEYTLLVLTCLKAARSRNVFKYFRMMPNIFENLLKLIAPAIQKNNRDAGTHWCRPKTFTLRELNFADFAV